MPSRRRLAVLLAAALVPAAAAPPATAAAGPAGLALSVGAFDVLGGDAAVAEAGVEVRLVELALPLAGRRLPLTPGVGISANGDGAIHAYVTLRTDLVAALGAVGSGGGPDAAAASDRSWRLVPFTGVGWYERGDDGKELGGGIQFRSGLEVSRRVGARSWLGLSFHHLSNAGLERPNPGSESLLLVWSWR
jgi:hypothetical protein